MNCEPGLLVVTMSGHSKWSTIKRQKGVADARRGNVFTKLSNVITVAVREGGGGDSDSNFKLRLAIEKAKEANMPKENISRAIDRGLGRGEGASLETVLFEGFGPSGVAVLVEAITDNNNRTSSEIRNVFSKHGGTLGGPGSVAYMFQRLGEVELSKTSSYDEIFEKAIDAGAVDIEETENLFLVYTRPEDLHRVGEILGKTGNLIFRPNKETMMAVSDPEKLQDFLDAVEGLDDVQEIYVNV